MVEGPQLDYVNTVPNGYAGSRCQHEIANGRRCGLPAWDEAPEPEEKPHCAFHSAAQPDDISDRLEEAVRSGARLDRANLSGARLEGADLPGAHLDQANLSGAKLVGADLSSARLWVADLSGARLDRAILCGAHLEGADLSGAHLDQANLSGAKLVGADLLSAWLVKGADLSSAHLDGASLSGARVSEANLSEARLEGADMSDADLDRSNLSGAQLMGTDLTKALLRGANLSGARLDRAILCHAHLDGAKLSGASLYQADMSGVRCEGAEARGSDLRGTNISVTSTLRTYGLGGKWSLSTMSGADLRGVDFRGARFGGAIIAPETNLDGAKFGRCPLTPPEHEIRDGLGGAGNHECAQVYRQLKLALQDSGDYERAGQFYLHEMRCLRLLAKAERNWPRFIVLSVIEWLTAYGEDPKRVALAAAAVVALFAFLQAYLGGIRERSNIGPGVEWTPSWTAVGRLWTALYFSLVTFTTLGYGDLRPATALGQLFSGTEAILGMILMTLFLVCVVRKFSR